MYVACFILAFGLSVVPRLASSYPTLSDIADFETIRRFENDDSRSDDSGIVNHGGDNVERYNHSNDAVFGGGKEFIERDEKDGEEEEIAESKYEGTVESGDERNDEERFERNENDSGTEDEESSESEEEDDDDDDGGENSSVDNNDESSESVEKFEKDENDKPKSLGDSIATSRVRRHCDEDDDESDDSEEGEEEETGEDREDDDEGDEEENQEDDDDEDEKDKKTLTTVSTKMIEESTRRREISIDPRLSIEDQSSSSK